MKTVIITSGVRNTLILVLIGTFTLNTEILFSQKDKGALSFKGNGGFRTYIPTYWDDGEDIPSPGIGVNLTGGLCLTKHWGIEASISTFDINNISAFSSWYGGKPLGEVKVGTWFNQIQGNIMFFDREHIIFFKIGVGYYFTFSDTGPDGGGSGGQAAIELRPISWLSLELGYSLFDLNVDGKGDLVKFSNVSGSYMTSIEGIELAINLTF